MNNQHQDDPEQDLFTMAVGMALVVLVTILAMLLIYWWVK